MNLSHMFTLSLAICTLSACKNNFEDVSNADKYVLIVSRTYVSTIGLELLRMRTKLSSENVEDFYVVDRDYAVKHKSPEILSRFELPSGSSFKIKKILECSNCIVFLPAQYQIEVVGRNFDAPVYLSYLIRKDIEDGIFQYVKINNDKNDKGPTIKKDQGQQWGQ